MGGIAKGIGNAVGSVVGGITGSNKAADAQVSAAKDSNQMAWNIYQDQKKTNQPFLNAGLTGLTGLQGIAGKPIDRNASLAEYYASPEYKMLSDQARYQGLTAAEATGGLGSTATGNMLSSIAPQLGQNYLNMMTDQQNNMYQQLMGLSNVGLSAAGVSNAAAGSYANSYGDNMAQIGAAKAGNYLANGNALTSGLGFLSGTSAGQQFGTGIGNIVKSWF
ncbi:MULTISPECIES: DNA transfer protein [Citrobacter freundii complex]|uniref:DNA transfer protein n=1 Tax=Citrobacter freundii complex TaxID=1344959 RepID=UPI000CDC70C5|nr:MULTISPECIES: DNA transfer protein [Citrobacter freundii complex]AUZ69926.1 DNA transfer protein [Citrobacter freundii complex sp. CFNIH4]POU14145.1 DNA transfer protein [Citrobacter freundii complex sp. CFNIH6]POU15716.1 DNA transfer protein [Citrobacter freundii complex sp. CFNIH7]QLR82430.1 DNA transfer protein [Citrobacter freundii]HCB1504980.1 DNA transfer protein [Citrobacter freundii]